MGQCQSVEVGQQVEPTSPRVSPTKPSTSSQEFVGVVDSGHHQSRKQSMSSSRGGEETLGTTSASSSTLKEVATEIASQSRSIPETVMEEHHKADTPRTAAATRTPSLKDDLSPSAHRRHTLEYQSKRRVELEQQAACGLEKRSVHGRNSSTTTKRMTTTTTTTATAAAAAATTTTLASRPALRLPNKREVGSGRREMFQRESSWFTLSYASSSETSLDLEEQEDCYHGDYNSSSSTSGAGTLPTTNHHKEGNPLEKDESATEACTSMQDDNSSWSAIDATGTSNRRLLPPSLDYAKSA